MELLQNKRFVSALIVVVVGIAAVFGVNLDESALSESVARALELAGIIAGIGGGVVAGASLADKNNGGQS